MKILVGYDGSATSEEALYLARKHATAFGATVDVVMSMERGIANHQEEISGNEIVLSYRF
jgi:nucleotide-binding universal stress UspA family protein